MKMPELLPLRVPIHFDKIQEQFSPPNENSANSFVTHCFFLKQHLYFRFFYFGVICKLSVDNICLSFRGSRVVRWCWVNFQSRGVLQFGLQ